VRPTEHFGPACPTRVLRRVRCSDSPGNWALLSSPLGCVPTSDQSRPEAPLDMCGRAKHLLNATPLAGAVDTSRKSENRTFSDGRSVAAGPHSRNWVMIELRGSGTTDATVARTAGATIVNAPTAVLVDDPHSDRSPSNSMDPDISVNLLGRVQAEVTLRGNEQPGKRRRKP
jgi:hypothetical protein